MANIKIIDDDLAMEVLVETLIYRGHNVERIPSASEALQAVERIVETELVILDVIMDWPAGLEGRDLAGSRVAGMEIFRLIRDRRKDLPIIVYSATRDGSVIDAIGDDPNAEFISKWEGHSIRELIEAIQRRLGTPPPKPQVFIVHGHNAELKLDLKNYLQNTLDFPEPIILHEQPNLGRTIIEKFEDYAMRSSIVFVLLTPDDIAASAEEPDDQKRRGRQNVIFEMGYFMGLLGRRSGRVILLYKGPIELPSDLAGIIYIDVSLGITSAGEKIRRELLNDL